MSATLTYKVTVGKAGFQKLKELAIEASDKTVKAFGTIYVRSMAASTPPHQRVAQAAAPILSSKNQKDIKVLRERIAQNIAGVDSPDKVEGYARPVPFRNLPGAWLALDPSTGQRVKPRGFFGMIVPTSWAKVRGQKPPATTPAALYSGARWAGKKMIQPQRRKGFVRKAELQSFIRLHQAQAGKLISGWAPAARVFAMGKKLSPGFFEELRGKGFGKIFTDKKGRARGLIVNRQAYDSKQNKLLIERMPEVVRQSKEARRVQLNNILDWYKKQAKKAFGVN